MKKNRLSALLLLVLLVSPMCSFAKFPGLLKRYEIGYSFLMNSADLKQYTQAPGIDTTTKSSFKTSAAFGVSMGTYVPLKRLGRASSLALSIQYNYNIMTWKDNVPGGSGDFLFSGATLQMALPVGLDLKFGADAVSTKDHNFCATIGAGVYPSYSLTTLDAVDNIDPVFGVAPYVKAEAGFFKGICMKFRVQYVIGGLKYMDYKNTSDNAGIHTVSNASLTGKSNLSISVIFIPFSFLWEKHEWYNTF